MLVFDVANGIHSTPRMQRDITYIGHRLHTVIIDILTKAWLLMRLYIKM